ncbi:hypothetical protein Acid345_2801 [Candidatus Koribacter versatilis Ellin345]|uniref:Uncharacterized protein n=1 Tax=Koribacter versatilis (strain Ellin345) TaxID=204669 RepID=Q1IMU8_KORVE|nr:hypothetical protein [Candidatus Koribacter versatilis]ABF41802.1 hypothetical protein Acid345_2801 [Candidatus Koribacter versatilis Ellin345]
MRALVFVALVASIAAAQSDSPNGSANAPIRVCIAAPVNLSHLVISPGAERDRLVHFINTSAQKKNAKVRVDATPVDGSDVRDASASAEDQQCRFLVLSEFELNKSYVGGTSTGVGLDPIIKNGTANTQRASLSYRIIRVRDRSELDKGLIALPADSDEDSAATDGIRQLSVRVVSAVTKQRPPSVD